MFRFCKYFYFWWGTSETGTPENTVPLKRVADAFPGTYSNFNELVLLDYQTNGFKEKIWGTDANIRDPRKMQDFVDNKINKAINNCKAVMQVIKYQNIPAVQKILLDQATRVGDAFDTVEAYLAKFNDPDYAALPYQQLNLGNLWRAWIKDRNNNYAANKARAFLDRWVPIIVASHAPPTDSGGDTQMSGSDIEHNPVIVARVQALQAAYNSLPAWPDPFPADW